MVYKVQGNFNEENFNKILENLKKYYSFVFSNGNLFIALINIYNKEDAEKKLREVLIPQEEFLVLKVNEKNIMNESPVIVNWCKDHLVDLDKQRYEKDNQEKLKQYNYVLDNFEKILREEWEERKKVRKEGQNGKKENSNS